MINYVLLIFFLVSLSFKTHAQTIEFDVLYDTDKSALTEKFKEEIRRKLPSDTNLIVTRINLVGHTDSDASDAYNLKLSEARVDGVKEFLLKEGLADNIIQSSFEGESSPKATNATPEGKQANRRVHVTIETTLNSLPAVTSFPEPIIDSTKDTLITLPSGVKYRIPLCAYNNNPDCVKIKEILTAEDLAREGITTQSEHGEQLVSGGMIDYKVCDGVSVDIFIPVPDEGCIESNMQRWDADSEGNWVRASANDIPVSTIDNRQYYVLTISGAGLLNCDYIPMPTPPPPKTRFKRKWGSGIVLESVSIYCDCPLSGVTTASKKNKGKKVVVDRTCCPDALVKIKATDKEGNPLPFTIRPLSELEGNTFMGDCKTEIRKEFWFIRTWNKEMHRKYKLRKKDFK